MLTPPPDLPRGDLADVIEQAWGVEADSLDYLPVGFGSHHWMATDHRGHRHFLTVDELRADSRIGDEVSVLGLHLRPALEASVDLRALGCRFVVAPITTRAGEPLVRFDRFSVTLFPFIEGRTFTFDDSLDDSDRDGVLQVVIALHRVLIAAIRPPEADRFAVPWLDQIEHSFQPEAGVAGPQAAAASNVLANHEERIRGLMDRYQALVARHRRDPGPVVVTHGEIHPGNVMMTSTGWVIVDWDTALVAPPERDLWRLAQGGGSVLGDYAEATGATPRQWLLDLYALRWDLAEIASFAAELRRPHDDTADSRKALELLRSVVGRLSA